MAFGFISAGLLGLVSSVPSTSAVPVSQSHTFTVPNISGVITAGNIVVTSNYNDQIIQVGDKVQWQGQAIGPTLSNLFTGSIRLFMFFTGTGCFAGNKQYNDAGGTLSSPANQTGMGSLTPVVGGSTLVISFRNLINTTDEYCAGIMRVKACTVSAASPTTCSTTLFLVDYPINIHVSRVDNQNRACRNSTFGASCEIHYINNQNRACIASEFPTTCKPTVFTQFTALTGIEALFLFGLVVAALVVWSRSEDIGVQLFIVLVLFLVCILMWSVYSRSGYALELWFGILVFLTTIYLLIRTIVDALLEWLDLKRSKGPTR